MHLFMDWEKNLHFIVDLLYLFGHFKRKGICTKTLISINQDAISRNFNVDGNVVIYDDFGMDSTAVTRFDLICEDQYKVYPRY